MTRPIRLFILVEAASFVAAASTHFGLLVKGYEHREAGAAESVIALVLVVGLALASVRPVSTRAVGLVVQAFALLGTLVGIFMIAIGIGPRTVPDIAYHIVIVVVLVFGLVVAVRAGSR